MKDAKQIPELNERFIDYQALQIVRSLHAKGYTTYLVGGCVRDLLLGKHPKDYDIATNAKPPEVRQCVPHSFIIGKRFRLVLVKRGNSQYEVSTFRRDALPEEIVEDAPPSDNIFGTPEDDAKRRDFTINALFYQPVEHQLLDYANGLADLDAGIVRMIGDPQVRLVEDPIRIMRGIRLAHMIRFRLDPDLRKAIQDHAEKLTKTALPRRREELLKYLRLKDPAEAFMTSYDLGALKYISPTINDLLDDPKKGEIFLNYLHSFHDHPLDTPSELFAGFMMAFAMALHDGDMVAMGRHRNIIENPIYVKLMRDELGMFKSEQTEFARAIHLIQLIKHRKEWERRGQRRRQALVLNDAFPLALKLAERDHWLSGSDLEFWRQEHAALSKIPRPKKPFRRRRKGKGPAKKPSAETAKPN